VFNGGSFTIDFLSASPSGFTIETRRSLLRHEPGTPLPQAGRIRVERNKEQQRFRVGSRFSPKVGIRNPEQNGDILRFDIVPVTFPTYKAIRSPMDSQSVLAISQPTGTASALFTTEADGINKLILQHRSPKNFFYGDIPGASIAGMFDGRLDATNRGRLVPIDSETIKGNNRKEMYEELGLDAGDIIDVRITGVAHDNVIVHNEFLLFGVSPLSAVQIAEKAEARARAKKPGDEFDFDEKFFIIDGTPESIGVLLTQVRCPLPPTHTATFVAAGYSLMLEREGIESANEWLQCLEIGVQGNYQTMDEMVALYWQQHADEALIHPQDKPARNLNGYDPAYSPVEQGLPSITDELVRVYLI
jgi:hypothetical protein